MLLSLTPPLEGRYLRGLDGQYKFRIHFVLQQAGATAGEHIVHARCTSSGDRSISAEVDLPPGIYEVLSQIKAVRDAEAHSL